jgi:hypothetical protein
LVFPCGFVCVCEPLSVCVSQPRQQARVVFVWTYCYLDKRFREGGTNSRARAAFQTEVVRAWRKKGWFRMCDKIDNLYDELAALMPPLGPLQRGVESDYLSLGSDAPSDFEGHAWPRYCCMPVLGVSIPDTAISGRGRM